MYTNKKNNKKTNGGKNIIFPNFICGRIIKRKENLQKRKENKKRRDREERNKKRENYKTEKIREKEKREKESYSSTISMYSVVTELRPPAK